jgi:hypothetical protein
MVQNRIQWQPSELSLYNLEGDTLQLQKIKKIREEEKVM